MHADPATDMIVAGWSSGVVSATFTSKIMQAVDEPTADLPDNSLEYRILRQIEFYFSDANILKDQFLLKSVKANKDGWVRLSTIAGFRRVQALTKDEDVVRRALKTSTQIELSEDGTHIRRKHPLPEWDKSVYSRTMLISRFKEKDIVTVSSVSEVFESMNLSVKLVRIIDPGKTIPPDLVKSASLIGFLGKEKCAVVEFDSRESALKALSVTKIAWPHSYCTTLQRKLKPSYEASKSKESVKKEAVLRSDLSVRPQISLTSCVYSNMKVELIRDPRAPPNENSVGFEPNWRETLRFQWLHMGDRNASSSHSNSISSDEFFTPQAPSPRAPTNPSAVPPTSSPAQPASQLIFFDEAIVSVIPTVDNGAG
ncbi:unnamed protein product [Taenia asiatica]|uniref:HTH La-type RNA-binding domain-containing protein n=1 Tax=Taenia asiatica TaxID=60517 RepID=A0A0R3WGL9_TAEAS|nr:unnamed protein product [Taenia asiatica]